MRIISFKFIVRNIMLRSSKFFVDKQKPAGNLWKFLLVLSRNKQSVLFSAINSFMTNFHLTFLRCRIVIGFGLAVSIV